MRRAGAVAALAIGLAFGAGCGGGGSSGAPDGASIAPKNAPAFISVVTKRGAPPRNRAMALAAHFPGGTRALQQPMFKRISSSLGDELDIVWLDFRNSNDIVGITKPANAAGLDEELTKNGTAHTLVDGWTVFADDSSLLDRFQQARKSGSLSDDSVFTDAFGKLPDEAFARAFVRGSVLEARLQQQLAQSTFPLKRTMGLGDGKLQSLTAALIPEQTGVKLALNVNGDLPGKPSTFTPELPTALPAGALAYFSFSNLEGSLRHVLEQGAKIVPQFDAYRAQLETLGGFSLDNDLLPIFGGEGAVALYPPPAGAPAGNRAASLDIVFKITDEAAARRAVSGLTRLAKLSKKGRVTSAKGVTQIQVSKQSTLSVAVLKGMLVLTNNASSLSSIQGKTAKLADDPSYKQAVAGSGLPSKTSGFFYANTLLGARWALQNQAQQRGQRVNPQALAELSHLQGLLLYATKDGGNYSLNGFLGIK
jgi:Protein of unknown function (DUF3352)